MYTVTNSKEKPEHRVLNWDKHSAVDYNYNIICLQDFYP